ncbi:helix-turn-helix domain-containing protein [bacterium]|nr:helix-turn-helix domain-containing protein [bacterium]
MSKKQSNKPVSGIGSRLKTIRKKLGMRQSELANRAGINRSYISYLENGRSSPTLEVIEKIAKGLGIGLVELFPDGVVKGSMLHQDDDPNIDGRKGYIQNQEDKHFEYDTELTYDLNPGLKEFLSDEDEMMLVQPTKDEVSFLKSIKFGRNFKPDKRLYREALLSYRRRLRSDL